MHDLDVVQLIRDSTARRLDLSGKDIVLTHDSPAAVRDYVTETAGTTGKSGKIESYTPVCGNHLFWPS